MYEKGTLLVDLVHRASNKAIWRATAVTRIAQEHSLEKRVERINEAAKKMFEKYPVRPLK
jgi:predicted SAM-dependent methyltransferase